MNRLISSFFLATFLFKAAFGLEPPKPCEGVPCMVSKNFNCQAGEYQHVFKLPVGWGLGEISASDNGEGSYWLFPISGGEGCHVQIHKFNSSKEALLTRKDLAKTFKKTQKIKNGFEAEHSKAWYACRQFDEHLVEMWYSLSKKKGKHLENWLALRDCVSVVAPNPNSEDSKKPEQVEHQPFVGWWCHHPEGEIHVLFKSDPKLKCTLPKSEDQAYLIEFDSFRAHGYFFIKWDEAEPCSSEPFNLHLDEMLQAINNIEPKQKLIGKQAFDLQQGYGYQQGTPYHLYTFYGEGFLFGFALKVKCFFEYDINELLHNVAWTTSE